MLIRILSFFFFFWSKEEESCVQRKVVSFHQLSGFSFPVSFWSQPTQMWQVHIWLQKGNATLCFFLFFNFYLLFFLCFFLEQNNVSYEYFFSFNVAKVICKPSNIYKMIAVFRSVLSLAIHFPHNLNSKFYLFFHFLFLVCYNWNKAYFSIQLKMQFTIFFLSIYYYLTLYFSHCSLQQFYRNCESMTYLKGSNINSPFHINIFLCQQGKQPYQQVFVEVYLKKFFGRGRAGSIV